jgi:DNA-binding Xre family transcriptional regulator
MNKPLDEVKKALKLCIADDAQACRGCPYYNGFNYCRDALMEDAAELICSPKPKYVDKRRNADKGKEPKTALAYFRQKKGWLIKELAAESGIDRNTISRLENDQCDIAGVHFITGVSLAVALGVKAEDLLKRLDEVKGETNETQSND